MSAAGFVEDASGWARFLHEQERQGHGDAEAALKRAARKAGVPHSKLWSLVHRPHVIKDIGTSIYFALLAAYERECARQAQMLENQLEIARQKSRAGAPLVRAAARLSGRVDDISEAPAR